MDICAAELATWGVGLISGDGYKQDSFISGGGYKQDSFISGDGYKEDGFILGGWL